jgi:hypothetical protein
MHEFQPSVGQWYLRLDNQRKFEVIDIDDGDGMIEVQDEDGALDEIDADTWFSVALELTEQPQELNALFDNIAETDEADGGDGAPPAARDEAIGRSSRTGRCRPWN